MADNKDRDSLLRIVERRSELDGRFSKIRRVGEFGGRGNFSLLFRAQDNASGKEVALKFYDPLRRFAPDAPYRFGCFEREAKILEALSGQRDIVGWVSPIKQFTEKFDAGGISLDIPFAYFGLELANTDLGTVISNGQLTAEQILQTYHLMCRSVRKLHQLGYTHRDLKPSNFLLMADGSVRLSDFGTARRMDGVSPQLSSAYIYPPGDLTYAAPETLAALLDDDAGLAFGADVFALGAVLFEMVTGTVLGLQLFDARFRSELTQIMAAMTRGKRKDMFERLIPSITDGHPLPNLFAFAPSVPTSILPLLDDLYKRLAHLDYRKRLNDFQFVWLRIESCLKVLRNGEAYRKWREAKQRYKAMGERKAQRSRERALTAHVKDSE